MRLAALSLLIAISGLDAAQELPSALKAMKAIPKTQLKNLARIEAQDGTPAPERWHFLVHDSSTDTGLTEYVVARGELITSRQVSQFAETLTPGDVVGSSSVRIDSDKLAKLAKEYALVNNVTPASMSYELLREGADAKPVWKVACLGDSGEVLGTLVLTAANGKVVSHEGFAAEPSAKHVSSKKQKFVTEAQPQVAAEVPPAVVSSEAPVDDSDKAAAPEPVAEYASEENRSTKRSTRERSGHRSASRGGGIPNPISTVRRATRPVRQIVRHLLPF